MAEQNHVLESVKSVLQCGHEWVEVDFRVSLEERAWCTTCGALRTGTSINTPMALRVIASMLELRR
jgi:hypothetical protein